MTKLSSKSKSKIRKFNRGIIRKLLFKQKRLRKYYEQKNKDS